MSDCEHLEQQLAQLETTLNLLDALRADIPPDEPYGLALTGLCELLALSRSPSRWEDITATAR